MLAVTGVWLGEGERIVAEEGATNLKLILILVLANSYRN